MATSSRRKFDDDIARESRATSGDQEYSPQYTIIEREREDRRDERMRLESKEREERDRREREERDQRFNALLMALIKSKKD